MATLPHVGNVRNITGNAAGKHYKVELNDEKRKCQCVDHRIRRHDCKHIKLMLKMLGIEKKPQAWLRATQQLVKTQAQGVVTSGGTGAEDEQAAGVGGAQGAAGGHRKSRRRAEPTAAQAKAQAFL
jgi:hypothetical protein